MFGSIPIRIIFAIQTRSNSNEMISIQPVLHNKKQYLDLLLLADEQETMIDRYLERGEMFVLSEDGSIRASCVVTREAEDVFEIKNIAVYPQFPTSGIREETDTVSFRALCRQMPDNARRNRRQPIGDSFLRELRIYLFPPHPGLLYG